MAQVRRVERVSALKDKSSMADYMIIASGTSSRHIQALSEQVLEKLKDYHPIISLILDYRHINKLVNTYLDTLPNFINSFTNRVHTSFNQAIASTGRLSSNKPNFQNIPIKTDLGRQIRKAIKAQDDDSVILSFDYSQIELRILAHYSNENNLIDAFQNDIDIHTKKDVKLIEKIWSK